MTFSELKIQHVNGMYDFSENNFGNNYGAQLYWTCARLWHILGEGLLHDTKCDIKFITGIQAKSAEIQLCQI